jgi:D-alanyl-D-alanine carboxypeptidase
MRCAAAFVLAVLGCAVLVAQDAAGGERFGRIVEAHLARGGVGLSVAVVQDGRLVFARAVGRSAYGGDAAVGSDTRFAIGSVTKQFTCACVLLLVEDGKLALADKVATWYPELTRAADISVLDLMHHVSGYPDYYPLDYVDARMRTPIAPDELLRRHAGGPLDFEPGSRWSYSNTGYVLLGRILEKVTGRPFASVLGERILGPLGMTDTVYQPEPGTERLARGHVRFALGDPEPCTPEAAGWIEAAGGIWSTATDLAKWNLALLEGRLLSPASFAVLSSPRTCTTGRSTNYGGGLAIGVFEGRRTLGHDGAVDGFHATSLAIPALSAAVVVLANLGDGVGELPRELLRGLLVDPVPPVPVVRGPPVAETVAAVFARLQRGEPDRAAFTPDFDAFLSPERVAGAARRLGPLGAPRAVELLRTAERGGMEVSTTRLRFADRALRVVMYRRPDGAIAQFFVDAE